MGELGVQVVRVDQGVLQVRVRREAQGILWGLGNQRVLEVLGIQEGRVVPGVQQERAFQLVLGARLLQELPSNLGILSLLGVQHNQGHQEVRRVRVVLLLVLGEGEVVAVVDNTSLNLWKNTWNLERLILIIYDFTDLLKENEANKNTVDALNTIYLR